MFSHATSHTCGGIVLMFQPQQLALVAVREEEQESKRMFTLERLRMRTYAVVAADLGVLH
jgi:sulfite exporter TauE/SafE